MCQTASPTRGPNARHQTTKSRQLGRPCLPLLLRQCSSSSTRLQATKSYLDPATTSVAAFGPATIANLGPGFDWLGCAVAGQGDVVTARLTVPQR